MKFFSKNIYWVLPIFLIAACVDEHQKSDLSSETTPDSVPLVQSNNPADTSDFPPSLPESPTHENTRMLEKNWNLVSFPIAESTYVGTLMQSGGQYLKIASVWSWDETLGTSGNWRVYPSTGNYDLLETILPNEGYWVQARESFDFTGTGVSSNSYELMKDWNLIGYSHSASSGTSIADFLSTGNFWDNSCPGRETVVNIWTWQNNTWKIYFPNSGDLDTFNASNGTQFEPLTTLEPGMGLWLNAARSNAPNTCSNESSILGRVSDGNPIAGASLSTQCVGETSAISSQSTSATDGSFTVDLKERIFPCVVIASSNGETLRSMGMTSSDYVNINPVTEVITQNVVASPASFQSKSAQRTLHRELEDINTTLFSTEGQAVLDRVFNGGMTFSDFDKEYSGASEKSGANLADTLFRSVDQYIGGTAELAEVIAKSNDPYDASIRGSFLDSPTFQAIVASEIVAVSSGNEGTDLDNEIQVINVSQSINNARQRINDLARNQPDVASAARVAGAVLQGVIRNSPYTTDLDTTVANVFSVSAISILAIDTANNDIEGQVIAKQLGILLADVVDFTNTDTVTQNSAMLSALSEKTQVFLEKNFSTLNTSLTGTTKAAFLEQSAKRSLAILLENETEFLSNPANVSTDSGSVFDNIAQNSAVAFKPLEVVFLQSIENELAEGAMRSAFREVQGQILSLVAADPVSNATSLQNVGKNIGDFSSALLAEVSQGIVSELNNVETAGWIVETTVQHAIGQAVEGKDLNTTGDDLGDTSAITSAAIVIAGELTAKVMGVISSISGNILRVVIMAAVDNGVAPILTSLDAIGDLGFDVSEFSNSVIEEDVEPNRALLLSKLMEMTFNGKEVAIASNTDEISQAAIEVTGSSSDSTYKTNLSQALAALLSALESGGSDFATMIHTIDGHLGEIELSDVLANTTITDSSQIVADAASFLAHAEEIIADSGSDPLGTLTKPFPISFSPQRNTILAPELGKLGVLVNSDFVINFDRSVTAVSGKNITFSCIESTSCDAITIAVDDGSQVSISNSVVTINPNVDLDSEKKYQIQIDDGAWISEGKTSNEIEWKFETQDTTAPIIESNFPESGSTVGDNPDIVLNFSEKVLAGSGIIVILNESIGTGIEFDPTSSLVTGSGSTQITINSNFSSGEGTHKVFIPNGAFKDLSGNPIVSSAWTFTIIEGPNGWGLSGNQVTLSSGHSQSTLSVDSSGVVNQNTPVTFTSTASNGLPSISFIPEATGVVSDANATLGWSIVAADGRSIRAIFTGVEIVVDESASSTLSVTIPDDVQLYVSGSNASERTISYQNTNLIEFSTTDIFSIEGDQYTLDFDTLMVLVENRLFTPETDSIFGENIAGEYTYTLYMQTSASPVFLSGSSNNLSFSQFPSNTSTLTAGPSFSNFSISSGTAYTLQGRYTIVTP